MNKYIWISLCGLFLLSIGCKEELRSIINTEGAIPGPVTDVVTTNTAGGATISYSLPPGDDLLYVEAEYKLSSGLVQRIQSSRHNNLLEIEGFGDINAYDINLYSVGKTLKRSQPVVVTINPLPPPIWDVYESLDVQADFGGLTMDFENIHQAEVTIAVEKKDSLGDWALAEMFYTSQRSGKLSVRGMEAEPSAFRIYVRDRWGNQSDQEELSLTPLYEERIPKEGFREYKTPTDPLYHGSIPLSNLWNDKLTGGSSAGDSWMRTRNGTGTPHHFTFDMGVTAKLSRFIFHQRGTVDETNLLYSGGSPRFFELWGSNAPASDGSYDGWVKIMDCELVKPSGRPVPDNSAEDIEVAKAGHEYIVPLEAEAFRYLRIRVVRTFGNTDYSWWGNIAFYGQIQD